MKEKLLCLLATICIIYAQARMLFVPLSFSIKNKGIRNLRTRLQLLSPAGREIATVQPVYLLRMGAKMKLKTAKPIFQ